jgi:predicted O-methyltransferase YrrM
MKLLREILKKPRKAYGSFQARRRISNACDEITAVSEPLAKAFRAMLDPRTSEEEEAWIANIESLRDKRSTSVEEISVVDYGAVSSELSLTEAEMHRGQVVSRTVGDICRTASKPSFWAFLLFKLVRTFKPATCLELGTSLGISASYQAAALKLNDRGRLVTLEGSETLSRMAEQHFRTLGLDNVEVVSGRFQDTLNTTLSHHKPVDHVFVDGHHDKTATLNYFTQILPCVSESAVLVFDDISWSAGMREAWHAIEGNKKVKISADLSAMGVCLVDPKIEEKRRFDMGEWIKRMGLF